MKVPVVDLSECILCGVCQEVCPTIFNLNDAGFIQVIELKEYPETEVAEANKLDPGKLEQGTDFTAAVTVKNTTKRALKQLALTQAVASGWEIHSTRLDDDAYDHARAAFHYRDVRDDRILTYFDLPAGEARTFQVALNASYLGRFYLPMVAVEAMYDPTINARRPGRWVRVVQPGGR